MYLALISFSLKFRDILFPIRKITSGITMVAAMSLVVLMILRMVSIAV